MWPTVLAALTDAAATLAASVNISIDSATRLAGNITANRHMVERMSDGLRRAGADLHGPQNGIVVLPTHLT